MGLHPFTATSQHHCQSIYRSQGLRSDDIFDSLISDCPHLNTVIIGYADSRVLHSAQSHIHVRLHPGVQVVNIIFVGYNLVDIYIRLNKTIS